MTEDNSEIGDKVKKGVRWVDRHRALTLFLGIIILAAVAGGISHAKSTNTDRAASLTGTSQDTSASAADTNTPPPAPPTPKVYQGSGDDVVTMEKPVDGAAILSFSCPNCTDNTSVKTNGAESLVVNTIGAYSGSHLIDFTVGGNTTQVTITATNAWTLTISGPDKATQMSDQMVSGNGDAVLHVTGSTTKAAITNTGDENFSVNVYPEGGGHGDLPVNTIGSYKGTVPLQAPSYAQITSNGDWTVTPR